jgi:hypothetical protein
MSEPSPERLSELSALLEAALVRELRELYGRENDLHFKGKLEKPVLVLGDSERRLGQWTARTRTLEMSRRLVLERPWLEVTSVLQHEMAHQYVDEILRVTNEPPHGPTFCRVCLERGIDARAEGMPRPAQAPDGVPGTQEDRTVDRIRKLLALAGSDNQHEAEAAMKRAHELMLRANIEHARLVQSYEVKHVGEPHRRASPVELEIMGIVSEFFFVEVISVPVYIARTGTRAHAFELLGTHENVAMAEHVYAFLLATADRLWQENRGDRRVKSGRDRVAYQCGVIRGFREKLEGDRKGLAQREGLVWIGDSNLDEFFRLRHPRITRRRRRMRLSGAHAAGREAGRTVVLHRPVSSTGGGRGRLLSS